MSGARWAQQELMNKHPKADAYVLVIWFNMYPGDDVSKWPSSLLTDARVEHRWDEPKAAGRWFLANLQSLQPSRGGDGVFPQRVDALWDSYLMFGRDATWNDAPSSVLSWGYTMMRTKAQLLKDFEFAINSR